MKITRLPALVAALALFSFSALAVTPTSTINPNVPAQGSALSSAVLRGNFAAAANDVNSLWAAIGTTGITGLSGDVTTIGTSGIVPATVVKINGQTPAASATTDTTNAANITSGFLPAARLPAFTGDMTTSAGGVVTSVTKTGGVSFAASATTDTTNAANITTGVLSASRLPIATTAALGAVQPDGTSITIGTTGIISAVSSGSGTVPVTTVAASGTTRTISFASGGSNAYDITLNGNCVFTLTGGTAGQYQTLTLILRQDSTGGRLPTLPTGVKWPGGIIPTPNSTIGNIDVFRLSTPDGGTTIFGSY